jgi:charged multivesicular body protein 3
MEEMLEETLDSVGDDEELEEEADAEVDKVLFELTDGKLGQAGKVGTELPVRPPFNHVCEIADSLGTEGGRRRERRGGCKDASRDARIAKWVVSGWDSAVDLGLFRYISFVFS